MSTFKNFMAGLEILSQYIDPNDNVVDGYADAVHVQLYSYHPGPNKEEQEKLDAVGWFRYPGPPGQEYPLDEDGIGVWSFR